MLNKRANQRSAFTLVELLVVIAIIAILVSISIAAVFKTISVRQRKLTESSLNSLYAALMSHQKAVIDDAKQETGKYGTGSLAYQMAGQDINRARVIWIKARLKQQFPMTYAEATGGVPAVGLAGEPAYQKILGSTTSKKPATESAACLLMALTARDRRGVNVGKGFLGSLQSQDTDGDGIPEIVDLYGNPVLFVRVPLPNDAAVSDGNFNMIKGWDSTYTTEKFHDPQDAMGTLLAPGWTGAGSFASIHPLSAPYSSTYLVPVIVSAGPDGIFGLNMTSTQNTASPWAAWTPSSLVDLSVSSGVLNQSKGPAYQDNIYSDPTKVTP